MLPWLHLSSFRFCLCLLAVAMLPGCSGRIGGHVCLQARPTPEPLDVVFDQEDAQTLVNDVLTDSFGTLLQDTKIEKMQLRLKNP